MQFVKSFIANILIPVPIFSTTLIGSISITSYICAKYQMGFSSTINKNPSTVGLAILSDGILFGGFIGCILGTILARKGRHMFINKYLK